MIFKNKLILILIILFISTLFYFSGCGGGNNSEVPYVNPGGIEVTNPNPEVQEVVEYIDPNKPIEEFSPSEEFSLDESSVITASDTINYNTTKTISSPTSYYDYKLTLKSPTYINITLSFTNSQVDLDLHLYDSNNKEITKSNGYANPEIIKYTLQAGTYYIRVKRYSGTSTTYTLKITGSTPTTSTKTYDAKEYGVTTRFKIDLGKSNIPSLKFQNTGSKTWYPDKDRLGTWNPQDVSSYFYTYGAGWLNDNRIKLKESSVAPGGIGTFEATFTANPSKVTGGKCYEAFFKLVDDNVTGYTGSGRFGPEIRLVITVLNPNPIQMSVGGNGIDGSLGDGWYQRYYFNMTKDKTYTVTLKPTRDNTNVDLYTSNKSDVSSNPGYYQGKSTNVTGVDSVTFKAPFTGANYIAVYGVQSSNGVNPFNLQVSEGEKKIQGVPYRNQVLNFQNYANRYISCGDTCTLMCLLNLKDKGYISMPSNKSEQQVIEDIFSKCNPLYYDQYGNPYNVFVASRLQSYVDTYLPGKGLKVETSPGSNDTSWIKKQIDLERPVITGTDIYGDAGHVILIVGYNDNNKEWIVNDPAMNYCKNSWPNSWPWANAQEVRYPYTGQFTINSNVAVIYKQ